MHAPAPTLAEDIDPLVDPRWDALVAEFANATPFHSSAWARVLASTYGYKPAYHVGYRSGAPAFLMPLIIVRTPLTRPRAVCLPFTDTCGPLALTEADYRDAIRASWERAGREGCGSVEIREAATDSGARSAEVSFYGHALDLRPGPDELARQCHPSIRQGLRKAERWGLRSTFADTPEVVAQFYHLQCLTRRRHGLPPQPRALFEAIHREFIAAGRGFISMVYESGHPVAGVVFLLHGTQAIYKFGASLPDAGGGRANTLAMWEAIRRCQQSGAIHLDFGRTDSANPGLRTYKLRWGTTEREIRYSCFDSRGRTLPPRSVRAHGFHNRVFRHLPLPIARLLGTILYRFMG